VASAAGEGSPSARLAGGLDASSLSVGMALLTAGEWLWWTAMLAISFEECVEALASWITGDGKRDKRKPPFLFGAHCARPP
jgi:hypothetical protein